MTFLSFEFLIPFLCLQLFAGRILCLREKDHVRLYGQYSENDKAEVVLMCPPAIGEAFGSLHSAGSLSRDIVDINEMQRNHENFGLLLESKGIQNPHFVNGVPYCHDLSEEQLYYLSDEYKRATLKSKDVASLVDIILLRPTIKLSTPDFDHPIIIDDISVAPTTNLLFTRDQMITTGKGVVLGTPMSSVRKGEVAVLELVLNLLQIPIVGRISGPTATLEGGDFLPAGDISFIGQGVRTNAEAIAQLLHNDWIGSAVVAVVVDLHDFAQERMHLDMFLNLAGEHVVVVQDSVLDPQSSHHRCVDEYVKNKAEADQGRRLYQQTAHCVPLREYLLSRGFEIVEVPSDDIALAFGINFLNVGNGNLVVSSAETAAFLRKFAWLDVDVDVVDYSAVENAYGSLHCTTQVIARRKRK